MKTPATGILYILTIATALTSATAADKKESYPRAAPPTGPALSSPTPDNPVGWRYDGTGHFPNTTPPLEWSQTATNGSYECRNILWQT